VMPRIDHFECLSRTPCLSMSIVNSKLKFFRNPKSTLMFQQERPFFHRSPGIEEECFCNVPIGSGKISHLDIATKGRPIPIGPAVPCTCIIPLDE